MTPGRNHQLSTKEGVFKAPVAPNNCNSSTVKALHNSVLALAVDGLRSNTRTTAAVTIDDGDGVWRRSGNQVASRC